MGGNFPCQNAPPPRVITYTSDYLSVYASLPCTQFSVLAACDVREKYFGGSS